MCSQPHQLTLNGDQIPIAQHTSYLCPHDATQYVHSIALHVCVIQQSNTTLLLTNVFHSIQENRVLLNPDNNTAHCDYINASIIEVS